MKEEALHTSLVCRLFIHKAAWGNVALVPLEAALERNCATEDRLETRQRRGF
jgi:hypothetical protein